LVVPCLVGLGVPPFAERKAGDRVKQPLHCRFDDPTIAVQENGT
jgi:hypothetical protein